MYLCSATKQLGMKYPKIIGREVEISTLERLRHHEKLQHKAVG